MGVRELFRQKLEKAQVIPDASVKTKLMRRLARKEFLRFNPSRFNIYYLGGILIAGLITSVLLTRVDHRVSGSLLSNIKADTGSSQKTEQLKLDTEKLNNPEPARPALQTGEPVIKQSTVNQVDMQESIPATDDGQEARNSISLAKLKGSHPISGIFKQGSDKYNDLQGNSDSEEPLFGISATEGCIPLKIHFYNKSLDYDSCKWTFGDGGNSGDKDPEWIYDVEGDYKVVLQLYGKDGSVITSAATVTVHPNPQAQFEISPEKASIPYDEIRFLNYSANAVLFDWDFGDGSTSGLFEPRHLYSKFSNYNVRLVVTSEYGCRDSLTVINAYAGSEYFIEFPNAFIPNTQGPIGGTYSSKSDETALVFHPVSSGVAEYHLKIFSKLGISIFESNDINIGWDGYFKGQLSDPGVYVWKVRGNYRNGEPFVKMGDVILLKNQAE